MAPAEASRRGLEPQSDLGPTGSEQSHSQRLRA